MTSSGQSHFFSDELWTSSTYLSDKLWTSSQKLNDELWTQSRFFSAINCEEFEIKAKIRVENELFHFFHHAHRISETFLHDICQNSFSCDSPFDTYSSVFTLRLRAVLPNSSELSTKKQIIDKALQYVERLQQELQQEVEIKLSGKEVQGVFLGEQKL